MTIIAPVQPMPIPGLGHYQIATVTGSLGAGAATVLIFYARWTHATKKALITDVKIDGVFASTAYAVGQLLYQLHVARSFSAENGTPGGTALTITGNNQKLRTSYDTTGFGVIRISTTAALGAPTWTLDTQAVAQLNAHTSAGTSGATPIIGNQYLPRDGTLFHCDLSNGESPIVLSTNEGIAVQLTKPATGVGVVGVSMKWVEADGF